MQGRQEVLAKEARDTCKGGKATCKRDKLANLQGLAREAGLLAGEVSSMSADVPMHSEEAHIGAGDEGNNMIEKTTDTSPEAAPTSEPDLPLSFDASKVEEFLQPLVSLTNVKRCMNVILPLITGMGVTHKKKPGETFLKGHCVKPGDDLEALREQAAEWLPYSGPGCLDGGHGWALNHPLQKLIDFKNQHLLGLPKQEKEKSEPKKKDKKRKLDDPMQALQDLKALLDNGVINQGEFDTKKADLLARI